tara:strand:+ start:328 stop:1563 length:1236 start_codon:yes stop_codon:yes gene_type:complete
MNILKIKIIVAFCFTFFFINKVYASGLTAAYSCSNCDYQGAVNLAQSLYISPNCNEENLQGGQIFLGTTTFQCYSNPRTLIIANPITRDAFKFVVTTEQVSSFSNTYNVLVSDQVLTVTESQALETFYNIDADFREAVTSFAATSVTNSQVQKQESFYNKNAFVLNSNASTLNNNETNCDVHPANFLFNPSFGRDLYESLTNDISSQIGYRQTWTDFMSSQSITGSGLTVSNNGVGIQVNLSRDINKVYASQVYGSSNNLLNFEVTYHGDTFIGDRSFQYTPPLDIGYLPDRVLKLNFTFLPGSSRIDGYPVSFFSRSNLNFQSEGMSECLQQILEQNSNSTRRILVNPDGTGTVVGASGTGGSLDSGGTAVTIPGIYRNMGGCHIVELVVVVEYPDGTVSSSVSARWLDC